MDTHGMLMQNGKHKGERITRVPVSYLIWMVNEGHQMADAAKAELSRRGTVMPDITISGHAIDRASLRCRKIWHETALTAEEGLHAWLIRISKDAINAGRPDEDGEAFYWLGMKLVFMFGDEFPVLKTIMPKKD